MLKITLSARGTRRLQLFAALWLWFEALLSWCGPSFALALLFANLAIHGALAALPPVVQFILSVCFWLAVIVLLVRGARKILWPNLSRVKSRLERAGALAHQPLQTLADQPMRSSPLSDVLWQHHQFSAAHDLSRLRWPKLRADYALRDPMAIRWLLMLLLLLGVLQHGTPGIARMRAAFFPQDISALAALAPSRFHLYITPPAHTGIKAIYFSGGESSPRKLEIPQGSKIWLRVVGGDLRPQLKIGDDARKLARSSEHYFTLEQNITEGNRLLLRQGIFTLLDMPIRILRDQPPVIESLKLTELPRGQWRVEFCASDQYDLTRARLNWQGVDRPELQSSAPLLIEGKKFCDTQIVVIAAEVLAGEKARVWLSVENNAGLQAKSEAIETTVPDYEFTNPLAAKLSLARHAYMMDPSQQQPLLDALAELRKAKLPVGLYLALQNSMRELQAGRANGALADVWQIVMRIEEGSYADIAANWRGARDNLLQDLPNWRVDEQNIIRNVNEAADAWDAYAPAFGYDGALFDPVWENIRQQIRGGNRDGAAKMIRQFDGDPGALLDENVWPKISPHVIEALTEIRQRLKDPQLTPNDRDYLERLLQP